MPDIGIENRGKFYEQAGVVRDIIQNHMMQLIALVAMEPPDSLDSESIRDPYAFLERARDQGPIYHDPVSGVFVALGYDAITLIAKDVSRFSSINSERGPMSEFPGAAPGQSVPEALAAYREKFADREIPLLTLDPPHHTRMRTLCGKLFTPRRMAAHERRMQAITWS